LLSPKEHFVYPWCRNLQFDREASRVVRLHLLHEGIAPTHNRFNGCAEIFTIFFEHASNPTQTLLPDIEAY